MQLAPDKVRDPLLESTQFPKWWNN
jgi:hypothetical protein